jgi:hypothetical protein
MFAAISPTAGTQPFNDWFVPDTTQRQPLGMVVMAVDPFWGTGEFIYLKAPANTTVIKGSIVTWDEGYNAVLLPTTAGQGFQCGVSMAPTVASCYFWAQISGYSVVKSTSDVAADASMAVAAAGLGGALANGKQIVNCRVNAGTHSITKVQTVTNSGTLLCTNGYDGIFLGATLSGTGIPASTLAAALDPDGKRVYMGSAIGTTGDKLATASGSITVTNTFTGYLGVVINRPFAQGQIA